jgi:hypothetical protein
MPACNGRKKPIQTVRKIQHEDIRHNSVKKSHDEPKKKNNNSMEPTHNLSSSIIRSSSSFLTATGMPLHVAF